MFTYVRWFILLAAFGPVVATSAQEPSAIKTGPKSIRLNVHVAPKSDVQETGLQSRDFTVLDNNATQPIASFKEVHAGQEPIRVILLIDAVNTDFSRVAYVRSEAQKFLKANNGHLDNPTTVAVLTDRGTQIEKDFTSDGTALSASLDRYTIGLRQINRSSGIWGADERVQASLTAVRELTAYATTLPGRKIVLWISPGWPLLSGVRIQLDSKQQKQIFQNVVTFSQELQQSDMTLFSINPLGPAEDLFRTDYYQNFVKGISTSDQTDLADLSLQVLAVQSGGLALNGSSDVVAGLRKCLADVSSWYEITVPVAQSERLNEYHRIDVKTDRSGLVARTRDGYYAEP